MAGLCCTSVSSQLCTQPLALLELTAQAPVGVSAFQGHFTIASELLQPLTLGLCTERSPFSVWEPQNQDWGLGRGGHQAEASPPAERHYHSWLPTSFSFLPG